jgi:hypothetical protein
MEKHIQIVGVVNLVYRVLALFFSLILFGIAICFPYFMDIAMQCDPNVRVDVPQEVITVVPIILGILAVLIFFVSSAGIIGSIGVLRRKEWGRITLLVVSFFNLVHMPLGTILGAYSIWVLFDNEIIRIFQSPQQKSQ